MKNLYNVEKVLWIASQPKGLHVSPKESTNFTDLDGFVEDLLGFGYLVKVATDDAGDYYQTTLAGKIHLYELKIDWRINHGKSVAEEQAILSGLLAERQALSAPMACIARKFP